MERKVREERMMEKSLWCRSQASERVEERKLPGTCLKYGRSAGAEQRDIGPGAGETVADVGDRSSRSPKMSTPGGPGGPGVFRKWALLTKSG